MHPTIYGLLALDIAAERVAEAERRGRLLHGAGPFPKSLPRRVLERLASTATERTQSAARNLGRTGAPAL